MKLIKKAWLATLLLSTALYTHALPEGESVRNGTVNFQRNGNEMLIRQGSSKAIVNYSSFNVGASETVRFDQPSSSASILNRISGGSSTIAGNIQANGNVYLINRSGILFSSSAQVNVHGLVASSMELSDSDFLSGNLEFTGGGGSVVNQGSLNANFVYLAGGSVQNSGSISASKIALAAGSSSVKIDEAAGGEINLIIDGERFVASAEGTPEGVAEETTSRENEVADGSQETSPEESTSEASTDAETSSATESNSEDEATTPGLQDGDIINDGQLIASGESGGQVSVAASRIANSGSIEADGNIGPGGAIELLSKETLVLTDSSQISASANSLAGDGGRVILYTEGNAYFPEAATVDATSGSENGAGGFVEFSGVQHIDLKTVANVSGIDAAGQVLIDPTDIIIRNAPLGEVGGSFNTSNPIEYVPTAGTSEIFPSTIAQQLNTADVTISTASSFNAPNGGRLVIIDQINYTHTVERSLTLQADDALVISAPIFPATTTAEPLNLTLNANEGIFQFSQIELVGGDLNATANFNGGTGDYEISDTSITSFGLNSQGDINIKADNIIGDGANINGFDIRLEASGDIVYDGFANANGTTLFQADDHINLLGESITGVDGVAFCADHDLDLVGDIITSGATSFIGTDGGPIFAYGVNIDLSHASLTTPSFAPNVIGLLAIQDINLNNPDTDASFFGSDIYVQAGGSVDLGSPLRATDQVLVSAGDQINAIVHANGPNADATTVGLQALNGIGSVSSPVVINSPEEIIQTGNGAPIEVNNVDPEPNTIDYAESGDLSNILPPQFSAKVTPNILIDNGDPGDGGGENGGGPITTPSEEPTPTVVPQTPEGEPTTTPVTIRVIAGEVTNPNPEPTRASPPATSLLGEVVPVSIPAFGTAERERIERGRSVTLIETPSAKVRAVQFSEFYFMHERMQISEYANDLDLYFIDYLLFGVAELTADPRIPIEVKGTVIHGGPRPFQL